MTSLFLPFTPVGRSLEERAIEVKRRLGLGPYERADPYAVLERVPARLVPESAMDCFPPDVKRSLLGPFVEHWSAYGVGPSSVDGAELILLNPRHHEHRKRVSLMEEVVHLVLGHPRVLLAFSGGAGPWVRPYDSGIEDEAFSVGAACLIPYRWLFNRIKRESAVLTGLARELGVSKAYLEFRIKRAGLYQMWRKRVREERRTVH